MYIVNGKIYTDATLLDEIVYNCKLILKDIVVKNEKLALQYETAESMNAAEMRVLCSNGSITFLTFPWTFNILTSFGYTPEEAELYLNDLNLVPEEDRDPLLEFGIGYFFDHFEEKNKYYRSLMGLPEYGKTEYDIYLTPEDFPDDYDTTIVDFSIPLHEYPTYIIDVLQSSGKIDELIEEYRSFNYSYLRYLGARAINLDEARRASKWDILYMPPANADVQYRFQELYEKNKDIYLVKVYQDAYAFGSTYYDNMMIVLLLAQTFNDMIVDVPEWYIRKDIFDIRTVQYFLEAYGVPFFDEIPLKYQIKIVKNINTLIMSKSTIENFDDILGIFNLRETHIYRYYLYKQHRKDGEGHFIIDDDPAKMYELLFLEVLLGDTYDNYIKDLSARIPYDELTVGDQFWDGTEDHDEVKQKLLEKDFIVEPTKYITIKADIVYGDYQKQLAYFLSMIFDTRISTDDIMIPVPSLSESVNFSLTNLMLFIETLCHLYYKTDMSIIRPEDLDHHTSTLPDFEPDKETDDWWMQYSYPETFTDKTYNHNRLFGFNPEVDMDAIQELISRPYTNYTYNNFFYTLHDLYLDNYIVPPANVYNIEELMDLYDNNIECMEKLQFDLIHSVGDKDKLKIVNYVFNEVYTKPYDYAFADGCDSLDQVLANRDYNLYRMYQELKIRQYTDPESALNDINAILSDVVSVLSFYLNRPSLDYLFALVSNTSFESILKYIYWMLNAFKSYKLHFINPITKYISNTPTVLLGNYMEMSDTIFQHTSIFEPDDKEYMWDTYKIEVDRVTEDHLRETMFEILDIFTLVDQDPDDDYIYDGGGANTTDYQKSADGGTADKDIPFKMLNGYKSYTIRYDQWNLDFNNTDQDEFSIINIDGGNVLSSMFTTPAIYYENFFKKIYNCGDANTDKFINNNFFLRIVDNQKFIKDYVATRTGLKYSEDIAGNITLTEYWREWKSINDFEMLNDTALLAALYDEGKYEIWQLMHDYHELPYGEDYDYILNHPARRTLLYYLDNLMNQNINITIEDTYAEGNNITEADWNFGEIPDDPGNVPYDCNFGEYPDDPGNMDDDYEFGEISDIYYISKLGNHDSSRVISIPRTIT